MPRIEWLLDAYGEVRGKSILELGPFEGGHAYMLSNLTKPNHINRGQYFLFLEMSLHQGGFELNNIEFHYLTVRISMNTCLVVVKV